MNFLDRMIGFFSPRAGWDRAVARQALQMVERSFDGASTGRRAASWTSSNAGPNAEVRNALSRLRARSSELVRNTPYGAKAMRTLKNGVVGPKGLTMESRARLKGVRSRIDDAWAQWIVLQCDIRGNHTFGGLQRLAAGAMFERGDVIIRRIRTGADSARVVPLTLQMLEGDYLDLTRYAWKGNPVVQGVELDKDTGCPIAYWLWNRHPGELFQGSTANGLFSTRVPADDIIHIFEENRPGQVRGVPRLASVIATMRDLGDRDAAELVAAKIASCLAAFVTTSSGINSGPLGLQNPANGQTVDVSGNTVETFEPAMIAHLKPGQDVRFNTPPASTGFQQAHLVFDRQIAAGIGVMYEQMTGDLSGVNYSSFRAGHLEYRTDMECLREDVFIPKMCTGVLRWFVDAMVAQGMIGVADYAAQWTAPAWQSIDPMKDAFADRMDVRSGFVSPQKMIAQRGDQFDKVMADTIEANAFWDANNMVFDTDPRRVLVTTTGKGQPKPVDQVDTENPGTDDSSTDDKGT